MRMDFTVPMIEMYANEFKAYCKKRDMRMVMDTLRGEI
jgi:hypothetical protein